MVWNSDSLLLGALTPFSFFCFLWASSFQTRQLNKIMMSDLSQWSKDTVTIQGRIKAKCNSCLVFSLAHSVAQESSLPCPDTSVGMVVFSCDPYNRKFMLFWKGRLKNLVSRKKEVKTPLEKRENKNEGEFRLRKMLADRSNEQQNYQDEEAQTMQ